MFFSNTPWEGDDLFCVLFCDLAKPRPVSCFVFLVTGELKAVAFNQIAFSFFSFFFLFYCVAENDLELLIHLWTVL